MANTVKYDSKTGKKLKAGQSTTDALGNTFKQGQNFSSGGGKVLGASTDPLAGGARGTFLDLTPQEAAQRVALDDRARSAGFAASETGDFFNSSSSFVSSPVAGATVGSKSPSIASTSIVNNPNITARNFMDGYPEEKITDTSTFAPITIDQERLKLEAEGEKNSQDQLKSLLDLYDDRETSAESYKKAQRQSGILQAQQIVGDLSGQLNAIVAKGQAQQLSIVGQGRGIPEAIIGGQQAQIGRETAIAALPVQAQLSAAQGNLEMAQSNMETLFKIYSDDAANEFNFKKEVITFIYDKADKAQQRKLDALTIKEERVYKEKQTELAEGKSYAKMAFANGQSALGADIMKLDINSPTYKNDLSRLISQVKDPNFTLDLSIKKQQLANLQKQNSLMGEPTAKEKKEEAQALKTAQGQTETLKEKVSLIDSILENSGFFGGMSDSVGTNPFSRGVKGAFNTWTGANQQFAGGVHKLASQEFLNALINAKSQGATFGALTEREGDALRAAATQLNDWEIKNEKGLGTGVWDIDEESFKNELNNLKRLANKGIQNAQGTVLEQDERSLLDNIFSPDNMALDPALYY